MIVFGVIKNISKLNMLPKVMFFFFFFFRRTCKDCFPGSNCNTKVLLFFF